MELESWSNGRKQFGGKSEIINLSAKDTKNFPFPNNKRKKSINLILSFPLSPDQSFCRAALTIAKFFSSFACAIPQSLKYVLLIHFVRLRLLGRLDLLGKLTREIGKEQKM